MKLKKNVDEKILKQVEIYFKDNHVASMLTFNLRVVKRDIYIYI